MIIDYFKNTKGILQKVPIDSIEEGNTNGNIRSITKKYLKKNKSTIPPLVVENGIIMDGNHRYRVAKRLGLKDILIYNIIEEI